MGLKSIEDIEDQIEREISENAEQRYKDDNDREYVLVLKAENSIASEMAEGLLIDNGIEVIKKSNDARGLFGVTMFPPSLYVPAKDFERAFEILSTFGFFDEPGEDDCDKTEEDNDEKDSTEDNNDEKNNAEEDNDK
jgi:hypothetical protein